MVDAALYFPDVDLWQAIESVRIAVSAVPVIRGEIGGNKKYIVRSATEERTNLEELVGRRKAVAYQIKHANTFVRRKVV